ncbi:MAG: cell division protein FtsQ/DivIB [Planctomycetota bacterium]|jgi:hypothetical protein
MAIRSKRKKRKPKKISFKFGGRAKRKRRRASFFGPSLITILKVLVVVCVLCGIVIGLISLEKYVKETIPAQQDSGELVLADVPLWVSGQLKEKVRAIATAKGSNLGLDDETVLSVQRNMEELIPWLDEVKVKAAHNILRVEARWRKPIALIKSGLIKFYVDAEQVVLDYMEMPELPIVEIKGVPPVTKIPPLGEVWRRDDLAAAVLIINRLDQMDRSLTPDKPLLYEIDRIDVSNFNGRQNNRLAHIILYSNDDSQIIWGAEFGQWQRHLESTDQEKLAKLYSYYKDYGTLSGGARYINLRDPRHKIPLPIDKY